jgi:hypothetical protein
MSTPYDGYSNKQNIPAIKGTNSAGGDAIVGQANGSGRGVVGIADAQAGLVGVSAAFVGVWGESRSSGQPGVFGKSVDWQGVHGESTNQVGVFGLSNNFVGVWGESQSANQPGVFGKSGRWQGVHGESINQVGVFGFSNNFVGVWGESNSAYPGVLGKSVNSKGVHGESTNQAGVFGSSNKFVGVWGESQSADQPGVFGKSVGWQGIHGESTNQVGVFGFSNNFVGVWGESQSADQPGVFGKGVLAGRFDGDVEVKGDIRLTNADCAEEFDVIDVGSASPGTVMALDETAALIVCTEPYDTRVVGIVSGAGKYKPAITLDHHEEHCSSRCAIAMMGKVYCRVDASFAPIRAGDLLTTSATPGHAMRALDLRRSFGAVIGKALASLNSGTGLIPVLVSLK